MKIRCTDRLLWLWPVPLGPPEYDRRGQKHIYNHRSQALGPGCPKQYNGYSSFLGDDSRTHGRTQAEENYWLRSLGPPGTQNWSPGRGGGASHQNPDTQDKSPRDPGVPRSISSLTQANRQPQNFCFTSPRSSSPSSPSSSKSHINS